MFDELLSKMREKRFIDSEDSAADFENSLDDLIGNTLENTSDIEKTKELLKDVLKTKMREIDEYTWTEED